jgi:hypothetical protein
MSDEIKIPGPPVGYTDILDYEITARLQATQDSYKDGSTQRYFPLRPSAAGYCSRKLAYQLMEYYKYAEYKTEINPPNVDRLFKLGHSIEYSVLRQFDDVDLFNVKYKQQALTCVELLDKDKQSKLIEGSCDGVFYSEKYKGIMDVKSVKDGFSKAYATRWDETLDKFKKMKTVSVISDTAFYAHDIYAFLEELGEDFLLENIYQLNLYACSGFMKERGIDHAVIYKYNKNDSRHYELRFQPSQKMADEVDEKFNNIYNCVLNKQPEKVLQDYALGSMHCAWCDFADQCWPERDSKKAYFKTFPKKRWPNDIGKIEDDELEGMFAEYEELEFYTTKRENLGKKITKKLVDLKVPKIKLANTNVYEVKYLKSPKPRYELRRSKL